MQIENERSAFLLFGRSPFDSMNLLSSTKRNFYAIRIALETTSTWKMYANRAHNYYERKCSVYINVQCTEYRNTIITIWALVCMEYGICMERKTTKNNPISTDEPK